MSRFLRSNRFPSDIRYPYSAKGRYRFHHLGGNHVHQKLASARSLEGIPSWGAFLCSAPSEHRSDPAVTPFGAVGRLRGPSRRLPPSGDGVNIRDEIRRNSDLGDIEALLWLFERFHWSSKWSFVSKVEWVGEYPCKRRKWFPTFEGRILYENRDAFKDAPLC